MRSCTPEKETAVQPQVFGLVAAVNGAWAVLLLLSRALDNEEATRKRDVYDAFWREAHARRLGGTWRERTWVQLKTQHKLLRVLLLRFHVAQDPAAPHTGAQKATVLTALVLLQMLLATLFFRPADDYDQ